MNFLSESDLWGYIHYILVALIIKCIFKWSQDYFTGINVPIKAKDIPEKMSLNLNHPVFNDIVSAERDVFNPIGNFNRDQSDVWSISQSAYISALCSTTPSFFSKIQKFILKVYPLLERYLPNILFGAIVYVLIFVEKDLFGLLEIVVFSWMFFSLFITVLNIQIVKKALNIFKSDFEITDIQASQIRKALLLIHCSLFLRSWGIFWKVTDVIKWLFKND